MNQENGRDQKDREYTLEMNVIEPYMADLYKSIDSIIITTSLGLLAFLSVFFEYLLLEDSFLKFLVSLLVILNVVSIILCFLSILFSLEEGKTRIQELNKWYESSTDDRFIYDSKYKFVSFLHYNSIFTFILSILILCVLTLIQIHV